MLIKIVSDEKQLEIIVKLAHTIWHEYFTPIIGMAQVDYMLEEFQSKKSISQQIQDGFMYFLITNNSQAIGYTAVILKDNALFLSKFYIISDERNKGFGKQTISFIEQLAHDHGAQKISLTVNKNNLDTIRAYQNMGFENMGSVIKDIGENFIMDDYKMEKELNHPASAD